MPGHDTLYDKQTLKIITSWREKRYNASLLDRIAAYMRLLSFISPELHWDIITRTWIGSGSVDLKAYPYFKFLLLEIGTWRANLSQQVRVLLGFMAVKCWSLIVAQFISGSCWTDASLRLEIKKKNLLRGAQLSISAYKQGTRSRTPLYNSNIRKIYANTPYLICIRVSWIWCMSGGESSCVPSPCCMLILGFE